LDRPVSGVAIFARNSKFAGRLAQQFSQRSIGKRYLLICSGRLHDKSGQWEDELPRLEDEAVAGLQHCQLRFEVLGHSTTHSLVEVQLMTGRRHQIRRQFAARGFPIAGDTAYGGQSLPVPEGIDERFMPIALHSWKLQFAHPLSFELMRLTAPLPAYWQSLASVAGLNGVPPELPDA
jgi:23S rRNA pseudouridine1911/1915/1917 synthase